MATIEHPLSPLDLGDYTDLNIVPIEKPPLPALTLHSTQSSYHCPVHGSGPPVLSVKTDEVRERSFCMECVADLWEKAIGTVTDLSHMTDSQRKWHETIHQPEGDESASPKKDRQG